MFLDLIRRRNPRLIEAAIALHQRGELPANTYVIDLDAVEDNARAISAKAGSFGLTVMVQDQYGQLVTAFHGPIPLGLATYIRGAGPGRCGLGAFR